jgi:hypothetical protein
MEVAWRVALGTACAALALGLYIAWGPSGSESRAAPAPPAPSTAQSTTTTASGPAEITITKAGVATPVSLTAAAGEQIVITVTTKLIGHLAVTGDDEAGGFVEPGTSTLKFKVKKPGTYPLEFHWDAPEPFQVGELVVTP